MASIHWVITFCCSSSFITLKKRSSSELSQLRSEFNTSVRKNFLMDMGKQTEYLRSAGIINHFPTSNDCTIGFEISIVGSHSAIISIL